MNQSPSVLIIGAGLAGTEAAWQVAQAGVKVQLVEMRPATKTKAHHTNDFAELVCSNSFGALSSDRASGLLQEELRSLNSLIILHRPRTINGLSDYLAHETKLTKRKLIKRKPKRDETAKIAGGAPPPQNPPN